MVRGLDLFRQHFASHSDKYVLIGGTACTLLMEEAGLHFRATRDLDIVLSIEALDTEFVTMFWEFVQAGEYQHHQKSTNREIFYRFTAPKNPNFPSMLELFSRLPDIFTSRSKGHLTPIPTNETVASLSAILLDDDYYQFIQSGKVEVNGLPVTAASHLIPLRNL